MNRENEYIPIIYCAKNIKLFFKNIYTKATYNSYFNFIELHRACK